MVENPNKFKQTIPSSEDIFKEYMKFINDGQNTPSFSFSSISKINSKKDSSETKSKINENNSFKETDNFKFSKDENLSRIEKKSLKSFPNKLTIKSSSADPSNRIRNVGDERVNPKNLFSNTDSLFSNSELENSISNPFNSLSIQAINRYKLHENINEKELLNEDSFPSKNDLQQLSLKELEEIIEKLQKEKENLRQGADYHINLSSQLAEEVITLRNLVDKYKHSGQMK